MRSGILRSLMAATTRDFVMRSPHIQIFNRLINRPLWLWLATLAIILIFLIALGDIFWFARINVTYPVEVYCEPPPVWDSTLECTWRTRIPRQPFQVVREGDWAEVSLGNDYRICDRVRKVRAVGDSLELTIKGTLRTKTGEGSGGFEFPIQPRTKLKGALTLRARRLISAFSRGGGLGVGNRQ